MTKGTPVDQAFDRYRVLSALVELEQERARANPQDRRYLDLGITEIGDTKREASQKIVETFNGLAKLIEHVAILDMAACFERVARTRIGNAIGSVRSLIRSGSGRGTSYQPKLIRELEEFEGLRDILTLVEGTLSQQVVDAVALVRKSRNAFAHGADLNAPPALDPARARDNLNEVASRL